VKSEKLLHEFVICHLSFCSQLYHLSFPHLFGYRLLAIPSEPGAVVEGDGDQEEDSFDHIERDIGDGEAK
jgi:hypothetical protein